MLVETVNQGVFTLDPSGRIVYGNESLAKMLQMSVPELPGISFGSFVAAGHQDAFAALMEQSRPVPGRPARPGQTEINLVRPDGCLVPVSLFLAVPQAPAGSEMRVVTLIDLTESKQAERAMKRSEEQLRQSQKMEAIGRLAGGVAHDFNNLLTAINGFSAFLLDSVEKENPLRPGLLEIRRAGERAASLTQQLLLFSRKQDLCPREVDLNAVITEMSRMLGRLISEDVELITVLDPHLGSILADPGQVEQIILNLALNARDAMPEGGKLVIETANAGLWDTLPASSAAMNRRSAALNDQDYVVLKISDTGIGMSQEVLDHLFEPFYTTKPGDKGTGLGLSTVNGIVNQSGGRIAINSHPGQGTVFQVYLPRQKSGHARPRPAARAKAPARIRGHETILLVEDEYSVRKLVMEMLRQNGYTILEAADGTEALRIGSEYAGPIHLLVTDVVMPGMNGRQLAEGLHATRPEVKVLYMSGYTDDAILRHGVLAEQAIFLPKPFSTQAMAQKVREVLEGGEATDKRPETKRLRNQASGRVS